LFVCEDNFYVPNAIATYMTSIAQFTQSKRMGFSFIVWSATGRSSWNWPFRMALHLRRSF